MNQSFLFQLNNLIQLLQAIHSGYVYIVRSFLLNIFIVFKLAYQVKKMLFRRFVTKIFTAHVISRKRI